MNINDVEARSEIKVLLVDDETRVLEGLERQLSLDHEIFTANSGFEALRLIRDEGPFDVIISDMRMPRMTGAVFFSRVRELWPDTARVLLTGYADASDAADAINRGSIFRYLNKPCDAETLSATIRDAASFTAEQRAQRSVLQDTLRGMVGVMSELVSFIDPASFEGAHRVRALATRIAKELELSDTWQLELAAAMYPLGRVFDVANGQRLAPPPGEGPAPAQLLRSAGLVDQVARLDGVARILTALAPDRPLPADGVEALSAEILRLAIALQRAERVHGDLELASASVRDQTPARLLPAMAQIVDTQSTYTCVALPVGRLEPGMTLDQDVTMDDKVLATRGQPLTTLMCRRLDEIARRGAIAPTVRVVVRNVTSDLGQNADSREVAGANAP